MSGINSLIWNKKDLTPHQKFILLAIADHRSCTIKVICNKTGSSERWVRQCIKDLIKLRLIRVQSQQNVHTYAPSAELYNDTHEVSAEVSALRAYPKNDSHRTHARVVDNNIYTTSGSGKVLCTNTSTNNILIFKSTNVRSSNTRVNPNSMDIPPMQQRIIDDEEKYKSLSPSEKEMNLYRLLSAFKRHVSPSLCITLIDDRRSPYRENGGRLTHELEDLWRSTLRKYLIDYQIKFDELLYRIERLGKYIGQRKPIQLKDRQMSFLEFLTSKHRYFEKWMAIALTDPSCEIKETQKKEMERPIKTATETQEERLVALEAMRILKEKFKVGLQIA